MKEVCVMFVICVGMANEHEDQKQAWLHDLDESDVLLSQQKVKVARKEKQP